jgi:hypothetical protein
LIFGLERGSTDMGICVQVGQRTTSACFDRARALDASPAVGTAPASRRRIKPFVLLAHPQEGLARATLWNTMREQLNQVCTSGSKSAVYHCSECNIIADALKTANAGFSGANECGEILEAPANNAPRSAASL